MNPRENSIRLAIHDFENGVYPYLSTAAVEYSVPRTTLITRMNGATDTHTAHEHQQRLTSLQEESLAEWILEEEARGYPPTHVRAQEMASCVLRSNGDSRPLGKRWIRSFIQRNPRIASVVGKKIEPSRIESTTPEQLQGFFDRYDRVRRQYDIMLDDTWNMDEVGTALGICSNTRVLSGKKKARTYVKKAKDKREWVSVLECINTTGRKLRPLTVFKGKSVQMQWLPATVPDWVYATSENGWTSNEIGLYWLREVFLPETRPEEGRYRMLILDGHESHIAVDFLWECKQNRVQLVFLPAHSTHVLQPLDLSCFSPVKTKYRQQIAELACLDDSAPVKKNRFIECYCYAREEALTERVIRSGWKAAGLVPWNPQKALSSSQVLQKPEQPKTPSPQRKRALPPEDDYLQTPQGPQQMHSLKRSLSGRGELPREVRNALGKAGKAIGRQNSVIAGLTIANKRLEAEIESLKARLPQKKAAVDPNKRFLEIEDIKKARDRETALEAQRGPRKRGRPAKKQERAPLEPLQQPMTLVWSLNE
jgi:hypothetical protein